MLQSDRKQLLCRSCTGLFISADILICYSFVRRRKISSRERPWEPSFSKPEQCVIVWPEQAPENVDILTTLYKGPNDDTFDDKVSIP